MHFKWLKWSVIHEHTRVHLQTCIKVVKILFSIKGVCVCCVCVYMTNEADVSPDPNDDERKIYFQKYSLYAHRKINKFKLNHTRTPTVIFLGTSHLFLLLFFFSSLKCLLKYKLKKNHQVIDTQRIFETSFGKIIFDKYTILCCYVFF